MKKFWPELVLLLVVLGLVLPSLWLPWSLIDDALYQRLHSQWLQLIKKEGAAGIFKFFEVYTLPNPGPLYFLMEAVKYALTRGNVHLLHGLMILQLLCTVGIWYWLVQRIAGRREPALLACGFLVFFAPMEHHLNFNAYLANWYRLYATDSALALFLVGFLALLFASREPWRRGRNGRWLFVFSVLLYCCALAIKKTTVALLLPCFSMLTITVLGKSEEKGFWLRYVLVLVPLSAAYLLLPVPWRVTSGYTEAYVLHPRLIIHNLITYTGYLLEGYGPLLLLCAGALLYRLFKRELRGTSAFTGELFAIFAFIGLLLVYCPWRYYLPRYLLPAVMPLSLLMGIEISELLQRSVADIRRLKESHRLLAALVILVCFGLFSTLLAAGVLVLLLVVYRAWKGELRLFMQGLLSLLTLASVVGFIVFSLWAEKNFIANYLKTERFNFQWVEQVGKEIEGEENILVMAREDNELLGSLSWYLRFMYKKTPTFHLSGKGEQPRLADHELLLYNREFAPLWLKGEVVSVPLVSSMSSVRQWLEVRRGDLLEQEFQLSATRLRATELELKSRYASAAPAQDFLVSLERSEPGEGAALEVSSGYVRLSLPEQASLMFEFPESEAGVQPGMLRLRIRHQGQGVQLAVLPVSEETSALWHNGERVPYSLQFRLLGAARLPIVLIREGKVALDLKYPASWLGLVSWERRRLWRHFYQELHWALYRIQ